MKVICIDGNFISSITGKKLNKCPKEGEIVTVISKKYIGFYSLKEYPISESGFNAHWNNTKFIPLSNIDEKELIKERELLTGKI